MNGDGFADVIVGAYLYDAGTGGLTFGQDGAAFLYHGSPAGLSTSANWIVQGDQKFARFGLSVASAGDVNGDGFADVIVGAYLYDADETSEGRAFLYQGSASGLSTSPAWTAEADQALAEFGYSVASAGDVNGDGLADVIVGAPGFDADKTNEGRAFLYQGSASGLSTSPAWSAEGSQANAWFGFSVASAGDVNGDGLADVIVGAPDPYLLNVSETDVGRAFVYYGPGLTVAISQSDDTTNIAEGGATDSYEIFLTIQPSADVTVALSPDDQITVTPTVLIFTPTNWNAPQTVTVTAVDDGVFEGEHAGTVAHSVSSADPRYDGTLVVSVTATISDNDAPPDTTDPTVTITSPADLSTLTFTSVIVSGTALDDVAVERVELSTDGMTWITATGVTDWSGTLTLVEGSNTIYVRVTDTSGNSVTTSIAATVTLPPSGLQLSPTVIAVLLAVAVVVAVILSILFLRKRRGS